MKNDEKWDGELNRFSVFGSVLYPTACKMAVVASLCHILLSIIKGSSVACLCHIQHHTRWQWWPLCVIFSSIQDGSVYLSLSYSTACEMIVFASVCYFQYHTRWQLVFVSVCHIQQHTRWMCLPLCVIIQHHARWQCVPLDVTFNILQYGSVYLFMSYSTACEMAVFCLCLLYSTAYKMPVFASLCNYWTSCKVTVLASLCRIWHDITWQRLPQSLSVS